jgi:hypothetical protein
MNKPTAVQAIVKAMSDATAHRMVLRAKGFTRKEGELAFTRIDADLFYDQASRKWVCDVFRTEDGKRISLFTRKAHAMLNVLLKSFI